MASGEGFASRTRFTDSLVVELNGEPTQEQAEDREVETAAGEARQTEEE